MKTPRQTVFLVGPLSNRDHLHSLFNLHSISVVGNTSSLTEAAGQICSLAPELVCISGAFSPQAVATFFSALAEGDNSPAFSLLLAPPAESPATPRLSRREFQTLIDIASGYSTKQIAAHLGIGVRTVETYRMSLKHKLHAAGPAELAMCAVQLGFYRP